MGSRPHSPPDFCRSVTLISTRGVDSAHPIITRPPPPRFSDLPRSLNLRSSTDSNAILTNCVKAKCQIWIKEQDLELGQAGQTCNCRGVSKHKFQINKMSTFLTPLSKSCRADQSYLSQVLLNIELTLWHTQLIVCAVKCQIMVKIMGYFFHFSILNPATYVFPHIVSAEAILF